MTSERTIPCDDAAGRLMPAIDLERCEGDRECVLVCPFKVFEVRRLTMREWWSRPGSARLRILVYGGKQAFTVNADDCHACGLCVKACPEHAVALSARRAG
jgi:4Fe-4S ferredoxin